MKFENRDELIKNISVNPKITILNALKQMDCFETKLLIVIEDEKFVSLLSIGDIQRAILRNVSLDTPIGSIFRKKITLSHTAESFEQIKNKMLSLKTEFMPVVNSDNEIVTIYFWKDIFGQKYKSIVHKLDIPVVVMAGGKGTRLKPLTNIIPKPLIPIDDKSIMERIIESFCDVGSNKFFVTVNYKADMIKHYFDSIDKNYTLEYAHEKSFLGTAGSLYLLREELKSTFFVTNCDILINQDYTEIYDVHIQNKNHITIVVAIKNFHIPYGTIKMDEIGAFKSLEEKPELSYMINTGVYVLEPTVLDEIQDNEFLHITSLIERCNSKGLKVGIFPISEGSWQDMGQWDEYLKIIGKTV